MKKRPLSVLRVLAVNDIYRLDLLPSLSTLFDAKREEARQIYGFDVKTIACVAGDFLSPNILSGFDRGRGFLQCFNTLGITHACFGNHEADLQLHDLRKRCSELEGVWLNTNIPSFPIDDFSSGYVANRRLPRYDVVEVRGVRYGLIGLLTDEKQVFFTDTFKGLPIDNVVEAAEEVNHFLRKPVAEGGAGCDVVLALTHQSMKRDRELARAVALDMIIGGHDHTAFDETVAHRGSKKAVWSRRGPIGEARKGGWRFDDGPSSDSSEAATVRIVKAGMDAEYCSVIDIIVERNETHSRVQARSRQEEVEEDSLREIGASVGQVGMGGRMDLSSSMEGIDMSNTGRSEACRVEIQYALETTAAYPGDVNMALEVADCLGVVARLENERIVVLDEPVSGVGSRFRQTGLGSLLTTAVRDELGVEVRRMLYQYSFCPCSNICVGFLGTAGPNQWGDDQGRGHFSVG
jgi:hypothetical protein